VVRGRMRERGPALVGLEIGRAFGGGGARRRRCPGVGRVTAAQASTRVHTW
jgi:hypothetical protein